jgi:hypothetical protein
MSENRQHHQHKSKKIKREVDYFNLDSSTSSSSDEKEEEIQRRQPKTSFQFNLNKQIEDEHSQTFTSFKTDKHEIKFDKNNQIYDLIGHKDCVNRIEWNNDQDLLLSSSFDG